MKKEIVFLSALAAVAVSAQTFPVGTVTLDSLSIDVPVYYLQQGTEAPTDVYVELLASAPGANTWTSVDVMSVSKGSVMFYDNGAGKGSGYYFFDGDQTVTAVAPGASADFQLRAWTGAATYTDAAAVTTGFTTKFFTQNTAIFNGPPNQPTLNPLAISGDMTVGAVPEPATLALLAIGGAALFFRRRQ
jgi:hypothetical protein